MKFQCRSCNSPLTIRANACPSCGKRVLDPAFMYYSTFLYPFLVVTSIVIALINGLELESLVVVGTLAVAGIVGLFWIRKHTPINSSIKQNPP